MGAAAGPAIGALIGAGAGGLKANEEAAKQREMNALAASQTAISPLFSIQTGQAVRPGQIGTTSEFNRYLQGAMAGAQFGGQFMGGGNAAGNALMNNKTKGELMTQNRMADTGSLYS